MPWFRLTAAGGATLSLHVQPGAKKSECAGLHGEALKIRLAAPPVDGKANEALLRFLAQRLAIPRQQISLKSGQTSRQKVVEIESVTAERLVALLT
ncbi:MAG TPA: YggU family protein [Rhodocyclaceae bacterium]|nr:YggU family protein [Rhodocyclaceae bacterium]